MFPSQRRPTQPSHLQSGSTRVQTALSSLSLHSLIQQLHTSTSGTESVAAILAPAVPAALTRSPCEQTVTTSQFLSTERSEQEPQVMDGRSIRSSAQLDSSGVDSQLHKKKNWLQACWLNGRTGWVFTLWLPLRDKRTIP